LLDGGSASSNAYAALRRIATEEGLRTLGERDPGHLELSTSGTSADVRAATGATVSSNVVTRTDKPTIPMLPSAAQTAVTAPVARVAQVAQVATVASATRFVETKVAKPAEVSRVASVARPGVASSLTQTSAPRNAQAAQANAQPQVNVVASQANSGNQQFGASQDERGQQQNSDDRENTGYATAYGVSKRTEFAVPNLVAAPTAATSQAHRAAQIIAAHEDAPAKPLSQIVMAVDAGNGTTDRIQLDLRGSSLNAKIDASDEHTASRMDAHKSELVRTLTRDGLDVESLEIRNTSTVATTVAAESAHRSSDSSSNGRSERGAQWQQQQHRQRSENERRQQQREERGGKK
jgi:hypothetical protein